MRIEPHPWREIGQVRVGRDGKLVMPNPSVSPGIYRFRLAGADAPSVYIGESDDLRRRLGHYRNPGPSQRTNVRMNDLVRACLAAGGAVQVAVVTEALLWVAECVEPLDLRQRASRLLLEEHLIGSARDARIETVDNIR
jgi:hypothetical protein